MDKKGRVYICHTYYHVFVSCLKKQFYKQPEILFNWIKKLGLADVHGFRGFSGEVQGMWNLRECVYF